MSNPPSIALVGIGGYGNSFVNALFDPAQSRAFRLAGTIDPSPNSCRKLEELKARKIPHYPSLEAFYAEQTADLAVISTPLQLHAAHASKAMESGSHVLCEKPLCVTLDQARQMLQTRDRTGRHVAIGYQWSFSRAIQQLKADVLSGRFGRPRRLRTLVLWPRDEAYYARNRWAGAIKDVQGNLVLDSPVNNACAHYLHNMLYVLGPSIDRSAEPASVIAELYRAHPIQNYDTAALRCTTREGIELLFIASHAIAGQRGPVFSYEFEDATVEFFDRQGATIIARFKDGQVHDYGSPREETDRKLWLTVDAINANQPSLCGIEAALPHTQCVIAAQESSVQINPFQAALVRVSGEAGHRKTVVDGLGVLLGRCYEEVKLPSEMGATWAVPAREISTPSPLS